MDINNRITYLIEKLNLKKIQFAATLNITPSYVTQLIAGKRQPSNRLIEDICQKFNVNETWLRTGEGEMQTETDGTLFAAFAQENRLSAEEQAAARYLLRLKPEERRAVLDHVRALADELRDAEAENDRRATEAEAQPKPDGLTDEEWAMVQRSRTAKDSRSTEAG